MIETDSLNDNVEMKPSTLLIEEYFRKTRKHPTTVHSQGSRQQNAVRYSVGRRWKATPQ